MFEIVGTHFERGTFVLKLEKSLPPFLRFFLKFGPIRGRLMGMAFLLCGLILTLNKQPMTFLLEKGLLTHIPTAQNLQLVLTYVLSGIGALIYLSIYIFRQEKLDLEFDRTDQVLRFYHLPLFAKLSAREGLCPFKSIEKIEVFSKERDPSAAFGSIHVNLKGHSKPYQNIVFKFLTEEQFKIYPHNIMKLSGVTPVGDFVDPDDSLA